jgi:hypothetical protein
LSSQYEHEGIVYHEPLPRVVLGNFANDVVNELRGKGHNVKGCTVFPGDTSLTLHSPSVPHEIDILILRDVAGSSQTTSSRTDIPFANQLIWPTGHRDTVGSFVASMLRKGKLILFFVSARPGLLMENAKLGVSYMRSFKLHPGKSAYSIAKMPQALTDFINLHEAIPKACIGLSRELSGNYPGLVELVVDTANVSYAVTFKASQSENAGRVVILPDYGTSVEMMDAVLNNVLPELMPDLFPFRHDLSWLNEDDFRNGEVLKLQEAKRLLQNETEQKLSDLDGEIQALENTEQHLTELLTTDGDKLKEAVIRTLKDIFCAIGCEEVQIVDVDIEPALRADSTQKREDLRILWGDNIFLVNVAGRERFFRPTSLNQISKHHRLYFEGKSATAKNIHSILIGNYNYGGGLDPRKRGQFFGSGTLEAHERLVSEGHGALTTYDLYRITRLLQRKLVHFSGQHLNEVLRTVGLLDFETFIKNLECRPK